MRFFSTAKLHVSSHYGNTFLFFFVVLVFGIDALQASMSSRINCSFVSFIVWFRENSVFLYLFWFLSIKIQVKKFWYVCGLFASFKL